MNGGKNVEKGSGPGKGKMAGKQKARRTKHCKQTQLADDLPGTGLDETTASSWPASQQNNSRRRRWPASRRAVQVGGGSAVVLATQKAGSDLPNRLPPTYRLCLSLYITTHSLNLEKPNLAPTYFFVFIIFIPLLPHSKFVP